MLSPGTGATLRGLIARCFAVHSSVVVRSSCWAGRSVPKGNQGPRPVCIGSGVLAASVRRAGPKGTAHACEGTLQPPIRPPPPSFIDQFDILTPMRRMSLDHAHSRRPSGVTERRCPAVQKNHTAAEPEGNHRRATHATEGRHDCMNAPACFLLPNIHTCAYVCLTVPVPPTHPTIRGDSRLLSPNSTHTRVQPTACDYRPAQLPQPRKPPFT